MLPNVAEKELPKATTLKVAIAVNWETDFYLSYKVTF
jgi:hypothetical protein